MSLAFHSWNWINGDLDGLFSVRFPCLDELADCANQRLAATLVLPRVLGEFDGWANRLSEWLWHVHKIDAVFLGQISAARLIEEFFPGDEFHLPVAPGSLAWAESLLRMYRERVRDVPPRRAFFALADEEQRRLAATLLEAQSRTNIRMVVPLFLTHSVEVLGDCSRILFGSPHAMGNLHHLDLEPDEDPVRWTKVFLALTALWECGSIPHWADQLWEILRENVGLITEVGFDDRLARALAQFASDSSLTSLSEEQWKQAYTWSRPGRERMRRLSGPADDDLWQTGVLSWNCPGFDVTPLAGRLMLSRASDLDGLAALQRRRIVNGPIARWLSAWATAIEESLRIGVLHLDDGEKLLRESLKSSRAFNSRFADRWTELQSKARSRGGSWEIVQMADFVDLENFWLHQSMTRPIHDALNACRVARNEIVHERRATVEVLRPVTKVARWLQERGWR